MSRAQQITHHGKVMFHMDFSNLQSVSEIQSLINESVRHIHSQPPVSLLTLTNIENMHFSNEIKDLFQEFIKSNKPFVKAGAVVGLSGLQQIIYNGLMKITGRDIKSFNSLDSAKEWLAQK